MNIFIHSTKGYRERESDFVSFCVVTPSKLIISLPGVIWCKCRKINYFYTLIFSKIKPSSTRKCVIFISILHYLL